MNYRSIFFIVLITTLTVTITIDQATFGSNYVGSTEGDCYHKSNCRYAKNIKDENMIIFSDECDAVNRGYRQCKVCDPPACQPVSQEPSEQKATTSSLPEPKTTITPKTTETQTTESKMTTQTSESKTTKTVAPTPESTPMTTSSDGGNLIIPAVTILGLAGVGAYMLKRKSSQAKSNVIGSEA